MFAKDAPAEQRAAAREDLEVLACILTCAFKLARRLHNSGALVDLAPIQTLRDQVENALVESRPPAGDALDALAIGRE